MAERTGAQPPELPEPHDLLRGIAEELGLDPRRVPKLWEKYPETRLFPEEAPTADGRYLAGACLEEIYNLSLRHTPPGAPLLLAPGDVRWIHRQFEQIVEDAWQASDLPAPFPGFTLTHLLGATKRQLAHLSELKHFHETDTFDPTLRTYQTIAFVVERTILDSDPDPQFLGDDDG
jgi:hypothetical protein